MRATELDLREAMAVILAHDWRERSRVARRRGAIFVRPGQHRARPVP
jgi:hypothetical protein